jgi:hypothetical protein
MCGLVEHECRKFCADGNRHAPLRPSPKGMRVKEHRRSDACLLTRSRQPDVGEGRVGHEAVGETARIAAVPLMVRSFLSSTAASVGPSIDYRQLALWPRHPALVERGAHQILPRNLGHPRPAFPANPRLDSRARHAALSKYEDAAEVQLNSRPGPQPFQSGAPSRHSERPQAEALGRIGGVVRPCGLNAA